MQVSLEVRMVDSGHLENSNNYLLAASNWLVSHFIQSCIGTSANRSGHPKVNYRRKRPLFWI